MFRCQLRMFSLAVLIFMSAILVVTASRAQSSPRPSFEVALIKPSPNCRQTPNVGPTPGRLEFACVTLRMLIRVAYGTFAGTKLNERQLEAAGGPDWLDTEWYQVIAKAEGKPTPALTMGPMLQTLLEDRFQVKVHIESRQSPAYALMVAKSGKVSQAKNGSCVPIDLDNLPAPDRSGPPQTFCGAWNEKKNAGTIVTDMQGMTMDEFAGRVLPGYVDRPVFDKTGLSGRYDLHLEFSRESPISVAARLNGPPVPESADRPPLIFAAIQDQLGLKLSPDKAPIEVIVVDSAAKPDAN
jgi:uncharacterized protein (TIGR03435 family)